MKSRKGLQKVHQPPVAFASFGHWTYAVPLRWGTHRDLNSGQQTVIGRGKREIAEGTIIVDAANHQIVAAFYDSSGFARYLKIRSYLRIKPRQ